MNFVSKTVNCAFMDFILQSRLSIFASLLPFRQICIAPKSTISLAKYLTDYIQSLTQECVNIIVACYFSPHVR